MTITREMVLHVARLARLKLEDEEIQPFSEDLSRIVEYVGQLSELDTNKVPPTEHVAVTAAPMREDVVVPSVPTDTALAEAPRQIEGGFAVPTFLDEG